LKIPLFKIYHNNDELEAVNCIIKTGMNWAMGANIREFEQKTASYLGVKHACAVNSGTSALHALLLAHDIGPGAEVIVPSFSFIATANCVLYVGAKPVFADIDKDNFGLDPNDVEAKITANTRAIIAVHFGGMPCNISALRDISQRHGLLLIEDNAESFGAEYNHQKLGSFGNSAILSFCAPKIITTGEGGMVITDSDEIYEKVRLIINHGRKDNSSYFSSTIQADYHTLGFNFRMSSISAALGIAQLNKIDDIIKMRRENAHYYAELFKDVAGITTPTEQPGCFNVYQMFTIIVAGGAIIRNGLQKYLNKKEIGTRVYFDPIHLTTFFKKTFGCSNNMLPRTENISQHVLSIPMYPTLTKSEIEQVVESIKEYVEGGVNE